MYDVFINNNKIERETSNSLQTSLTDELDFKLNALFSECGGISIDNGLYRVHSYSSSIRSAALLNEYFPKHKGSVIPFGYDWFGRQYAIIRGHAGIISMFDPAMIEEFQLEGDISDFHNRDLVYDKEETVSQSAFYLALQSLVIKSLKHHQCIGYKKPLFLGGKDEHSNYEIQDLEVYWQIQCQIF